MSMAKNDTDITITVRYDPSNYSNRHKFRPCRHQNNTDITKRCDACNVMFTAISKSYEESEIPEILTSIPEWCGSSSLDGRSQIGNMTMLRYTWSYVCLDNGQRYVAHYIINLGNRIFIYERGILNRSLIIENGTLGSVMDVTDMMDKDESEKRISTYLICNAYTMKNLNKSTTVLSSYVDSEHVDSLLSNSWNALKVVNLEYLQNIIVKHIEHCIETKLRSFYDGLFIMGFKITDNDTMTEYERDTLVKNNTVTWNPQIIDAGKCHPERASMVIENIAKRTSVGIIIGNYHNIDDHNEVNNINNSWVFAMAIEVDNLGKYRWYTCPVGSRSRIMCYKPDPNMDGWMSVIRVTGTWNIQE